MIAQIFTDEERKILEAYLTKGKVNAGILSKLLDEVKTRESLFEDVFLYLQVRKTVSS